MELARLWNGLVAKVRNARADTSTLDLRHITICELVPYEDAWLERNPLAERDRSNRRGGGQANALVPQDQSQSHPRRSETRSHTRGTEPPTRHAAAVEATQVARTPSVKTGSRPPRPRAVAAAVEAPAATPVAAAATPLPSPVPARHYLRQVAYGPPSGATGHPENKKWTDDWEGKNSITINFDRFADASTADGRETGVYKAAARARPSDRSMTKPRLGRPPAPEIGKTPAWEKDSCSYCYFRPKAHNPKEPWTTGTGDGGHSPYRCDAFKRYLAEGGESSNNEEEKLFLRSTLHFQPRRTY
jgi:hypothetical protein